MLAEIKLDISTYVENSIQYKLTHSGGFFVAQILPRLLTEAFCFSLHHKQLN